MCREELKRTEVDGFWVQTRWWKTKITEISFKEELKGEVLRRYRPARAVLVREPPTSGAEEKCASQAVTHRRDVCFT